MIDRIFAAVWLFLTAGYAWVAKDYVAQFSYEPIGPRAFPLLLALFSAACALWLLLRPNSVMEALTGLPPGGSRRAAILIGAVVVYGALFEWLGFPVATALATIVIGRMFGGKWVGLVVAGLVQAVVLYLLFDRVLDVTLPLGSVWSR